MSRVQFNSGRWTDEEHQGFLRGLEVHGRGNWEAFGVFVPDRSPHQIEEHARQHFSGEESVQQGEITQRPQSVETLSSPSATPSSSSPSSRNGGGGGGDNTGNHGGNDSEPLFADGVATAGLQDEERTNSGMDVATSVTASVHAVPGGLMPVTNDGTTGQPHQQDPVYEVEYQAVEPIGNLMIHEIPYPNPLVWEEPALGEELRRYFGMTDYCGVL